MLRVGRRSIVSFPNFGHWQIRFDLALRGRMPVTAGLPRPWYDTPNIHLLTLRDFLDWAAASHVRIVNAHVLAEGAVRPMESKDNLYAEEALLVLENGQP
jgi:methionine biosynthesis protein MetW